MRLLKPNNNSVRCIATGKVHKFESAKAAQEFYDSNTPSVQTDSSVLDHDARVQPVSSLSDLNKGPYKLSHLKKMNKAQLVHEASLHGIEVDTAKDTNKAIIDKIISVCGEVPQS